MADTPSTLKAAESYLAASLNLSDVTAATARTNLAVLGTAANLSDVASAATSRINLGVPRTLFAYTANVGNVSTGEDDLCTDTIAAGTLVNTGDVLKIWYSGLTVAHATATRQLRAYFAGTKIMESPANATTSANLWRIEIEVIRVSNAGVRWSAASWRGATAAQGVVFAVGNGAIGSLNLTTTGYILKITGEAAAAGAATDDIVAQSGSVTYQPGP